MKMKKCTKEEYKMINKSIKESSLQDFADWVGEHAEEMAEANGRGDIRKIFKSVKSLSMRQQRPPKNLTTNGKGKLLGSAAEVAQRWFTFLSKKFSPTDAELCRPQLLPLQTAGKGYLHEEEIIAGLKKMKNGKATGIDDIPAEIYKVCPVCKQALIKLLQKMCPQSDLNDECFHCSYLRVFV